VGVAATEGRTTICKRVPSTFDECLEVSWLSEVDLFAIEEELGLPNVDERSAGYEV
jgi:hypothetical protein